MTVVLLTLSLFPIFFFFFFFNDTATTEIYPLPLPDAFPIGPSLRAAYERATSNSRAASVDPNRRAFASSSVPEAPGPSARARCSSAIRLRIARSEPLERPDRKSTRLNSSHSQNSYAAFCLKKTRPPPLGVAAGVWHPLPPGCLPDLHDRGRGRVEAHPLRPARERDPAGERLLHRVLGREAPDVHDERLRRGGAGRGARRHALLRGLAAPVSPARRLPPPLGCGFRTAALGRGPPPGDVLRGEARLLHLAPDRDPLDAAALPLRPAHAARLAGPPSARAPQRGGVGAGHRARGAGRVSPPLSLLLAAVTGAL